jgi:NAD(P)-dependent dehydrogenase (short-subunit alcohol dehydrogenase family)
MPPGLEGKVTVVTGASSGIGRATALALARAGSRVVVAARREPELQALVEEIAGAGGEAFAIPTDVTDEEQVRALIDGAVERFGRIDCAFNNAGIEGPSKPAQTYSSKEFQRVFDVNCLGTFLCMKYEIEYMAEHGGGSIVNDASVAGLRGMPRQVAYSASKHAVMGMTRVAAQDYARHGIRVNAVCAGFTKTDMVDRLTRGDPEREERLAAYSPMGRLGTVEEVANAVVWLCSDESSFTNGEAMVLDGGLSV